METLEEDWLVFDSRESGKRYGVFDVIAQTSSSGVYKVRDESGMVWALKVQRRRSPFSPVQIAAERQRSEPLHGLPNLVVPIDGGERDGRGWLVSRFVDGRPFCEWAFGKCPRQIAACMATVAMAIHRAHKRGLVHRDLKSENILVDDAGRASVVDFGCAKNTLAVSGKQRDVVIGTMSSISPEQLQNPNERSAQSDVYSLGVMLYRALTNRDAFTDSASVPDQAEARRRRACLTPRKSCGSVESCMNTIVERATAFVLAQRYESAKALSHDLRSFVRVGRIRNKPLSLPERLQSFRARKPAVFAAVALICLVGIASVSASWTIFRAVEFHGPNVETSLAKFYNERQQIDHLMREPQPDVEQIVRRAEVATREMAGAQIDSLEADFLRGTFDAKLASFHANRGESDVAARSAQRAIGVWQRIFRVNPRWQPEMASEAGTAIADHILNMHMLRATVAGPTGSWIDNLQDLEPLLRHSRELAIQGAALRTFSIGLLMARRESEAITYRRRAIQIGAPNPLANILDRIFVVVAALQQGKCEQAIEEMKPVEQLLAELKLTPYNFIVGLLYIKFAERSDIKPSDQSRFFGAAERVFNLDVDFCEDCNYGMAILRLAQWRKSANNRFLDDAENYLLQAIQYDIESRALGMEIFDPLGVERDVRLVEILSRPRVREAIANLKNQRARGYEDYAAPRYVWAPAPPILVTRRPFPRMGTLAMPMLK